jgi:hypothetical protein
MDHSKFRVYSLFLVMFVFLAACNSPIPAAPETSSEGANPIAAVENPAAATEAPAEALEATEAAPPAIQHTDIPVGLPEKQSGQATDFNSSKIIETKTNIGGDRFSFEKFERPFNANTMDVYYSEIDIVNTLVYQDDIWIYGIITLNQLQGNGVENVKYAIELDINLDGKGDWLIIASKPASTEWTVDGVQIYKDANQDVGGEQPMLSDNIQFTSDGFETSIFDQGQGDDADSAWVRISPNDPNTIEFALKQTVLESPKKYLINMWAGTNLIDPAFFDISDKFTHEQAGAADSGLNIFYPIKEVAEIDNSCRMAVGFQPTGKEPGLCTTFSPIINDPLAPSGGSSTGCVVKSCNSSYVWNDSSCSCDYIGPK